MKNQNQTTLSEEKKKKRLESDITWMKIRSRWAEQVCLGESQGNGWN